MQLQFVITRRTGPALTVCHHQKDRSRTHSLSSQQWQTTQSQFVITVRIMFNMSLLSEFFTTVRAAPVVIVRDLSGQISVCFLSGLWMQQRNRPTFPHPPPPQKKKKKEKEKRRGNNPGLVLRVVSFAQSPDGHGTRLPGEQARNNKEVTGITEAEQEPRDRRQQHARKEWLCLCDEAKL